VDAALTVAAAVPGATLVPTEGLGDQVRLLLGEDFDGTVEQVEEGVPVTASLTSGSPVPTGQATPAPTLTSGELTSINAGAALCA
jgi:hypothetical protein